MKTLGRQLLVELFDCDRDLLNDATLVKQALLDAAQQANATIIDAVLHKFSPQGVSGVVVIAESHIAIHTWPEYGYAALDIFTCGETVDPYLIMRLVARRLAAGEHKATLVERGLIRHRIPAEERPVAQARCG
ncbi:adenosylmethionine decarboxylase [Pyrinomonas methylaliphatogenes]|jgi:S-adenosylmethionine decarboxylase proenzyme|uniref:S-adenosylmethionine decarboxylase proenzyme n=1 Tax=Pyrinomonas methylaliphatogenes TaxID=454194 RepID=A0A0B6WZE5_9BACT|nr:adenosylmethionine decarboxylase [Pyrinomonas methylaliphatogenes]MBX5478761.1 adenosylmethionine decarboxylase [Pyrinomonas methylaliphatogenes]CDM66623.1 adenosylmethionine decarboxylase proenzyme [Pyrinomonas methylaliphatogenes]